MLRYNTMIQYNSYVSKDNENYKIPTQPKWTRDHDEVFWNCVPVLRQRGVQREHKKKRTDFSVSGSRRG